MMWLDYLNSYMTYSINYYLSLIKQIGNAYIFNPTQLLSHPISSVSNGSAQVLSASCTIDNSAHTSCSTNSKSSLFDLWHKRLGHPFEKVVKCVLSHFNMPNFNKMEPSFCTSCCIGKIHKLSFSLSDRVYTAPLQLMHFDLWGLAYIQASNGCKY